MVFFLWIFFSKGEKTLASHSGQVHGVSDLWWGPCLQLPIHPDHTPGLRTESESRQIHPVCGHCQDIPVCPEIMSVPDALSGGGQ